jgi:hypothetical protein
MGQTSDQIKSEIDSQRQQLGANLQQLEEKVRTTVDWRAQFSEHPMPAVGLAFAAGFALSALMPRGGRDENADAREMANYRVFDESVPWTPSQAQAWGQAQRLEPQAYQTPYRQAPTPKRRSAEMDEIAETVTNIRGAVMGLAATRLRSFLAEAIPGFEQEYEQARRNRGSSEATRLTESGSRGPFAAASAGHPPSWQQPSSSSYPGQTHSQHTPLRDAAARGASDPGATARADDALPRS